MRLHRKLLVVALATSALVAALATAASARNFSITERRIRVVFNPWKYAGTATAVSCRVTLEGSFHCATIAKVLRALIGYISRATMESETCRSVEPTGITGLIPQESLPWHVTYEGFIGTLPRVRPLVRIKWSWLLLVPIIGTCGYRNVTPRSVITGPAGGTIDEGNASIVAGNGETIVNTEGAFSCPTGSLQGVATPITILGTTNATRIRLT
jgi:hypothetical protein